MIEELKTIPFGQEPDGWTQAVKEATDCVRAWKHAFESMKKELPEGAPSLMAGIQHSVYGTHVHTSFELSRMIEVFWKALHIPDEYGGLPEGVEVEEIVITTAQEHMTDKELIRELFVPGGYNAVSDVPVSDVKGVFHLPVPKPEDKPE